MIKRIINFHKIQYFQIDFFSKNMKPYTSPTDKTNEVANWVKPGNSVLDLGCGNGLRTFPLLGLFKHVYGVDASPYMIKEAKSIKSSVKFSIGTFDSIPLKDNSVDAVTMWNSLHFCNDIPALIKELRRILKPGLIYVSEPGKDSKYGFDVIKHPEILSTKLKKISKTKKEFLSYVKVISLDESSQGYKLIAQL